MERSLYDILGVAPNASLVSIRGAYRTKAVQMHPDKGGDPREFAALQESYAVLSNNARRMHYDDTGRTELTAQEQLKSGMARAEDAKASPPRPGPMAASKEWRSNGPASLAPQRPGVTAFCRQADRSQSPAFPNRAPSPSGQSQSGQSRSPERGQMKAQMRARQRKAKPAANNLDSFYSTPVTVPETYIKPVTHVAVAGLSTKSLHLTEMYPKIKDSKLQVGEVLLQMRALPLSFADLTVAGRYDPGDFYGWQGIAQVRLLGPQVHGLQAGDFVVPLQEVDEDGELTEDAVPATGRTLAVYPAKRCLRIIDTASKVLSIGQLAVAKSIGAARKMIEEYTGGLQVNDSVIVNAANGVVGQMLVQMLVIFKYRVFAIVREHEGSMEEIRHRLEGYGAAKVLIDDDTIRSKIDQMQVPLPELAFDGVGGEGTARIAMALSKTGAIVCYSMSGKQQVLPRGWGKKCKGSLHEFRFDEWVQEDLEANTEKFFDMLSGVMQLITTGRLKVDVSEYTIDKFDDAVEAAAVLGRCSAVVLHLPTLEDQANMPKLAQPVQTDRAAREKKQERPQKDRPLRSWDLAFLEWEKEEEEDKERREEMEANLFKPDTIIEEMRIQRYVDDSLATPVSLALGAPPGEANRVIFWLPGANEVPEDHGPWLSQLCSEEQGLRVLVLKPRIGTKWFDMSDYDCVKLGLNFAVEDDEYFSSNLEGDFLKSKGSISFGLLDTAEAEAVAQVESAAFGLARRAIIEEKSLAERRTGCLPFFFGGFGQGGTVALYTACCLMQTPILGVAFCHSGVPCGAMIGKRISQPMKKLMRMYAIYDKADNQVPSVFAEAFVHMLDLLDCRVSLHWLHAGDGHEFFDDAAAKVTDCIKTCFTAEAVDEAADAAFMRNENFHPAMPTAYLPQRFMKAARQAYKPNPDIPAGYPPMA